MTPMRRTPYYPYLRRFPGGLQIELAALESNHVEERVSLPSFVSVLLLIGSATLCAAAQSPDSGNGGVRSSPIPGKHLDEAMIVDGDYIETPRRLDLLRIGALWEMDEPVWLSSLPGADEVYRLWFQPPFDDLTIVRLTHRQGVWVLSVRTQAQQFLVNKVLIRCIMSRRQNDPSRCRYPRLKVDVERKLESDKAEAAVQRLRSLDLPETPEPQPSTPGFDGVNWTLEVLRSGKSSEAHRFNPPPGAFLQAAEALLDLAGISR